MKFKIDPKIIEIFPDVKIGILVGKNLNNTISNEKISLTLRKTESELRDKLALETLSSLEKIADWREAYRKFGIKPSSHRSSVEALIRRVLQGKELPSINPIVDLYNLISIKNMVPAGGDDIDHVQGDISLTFADGSEHFVKLGSSDPEKIKEGEVIYRDEKEVLCKSWNYRECEKSKITNETKNVCLVIEGLAHTSREEILNALSELKTLLLSYCQGEYQEYFLSKEVIEVSLSLNAS